MEEKDSAISGPCEEFRICFCGKTPSESVEWYLIDVSVEEACLSEKTESSTRELNPFSVAKHFPHLPSYAALGGLIYSLGGQERSDGGGDNLLNEVWFLDCKLLEDLKPGSIPPPSPSLSFRDELAPGVKNWQPERKTSELRVEDRESTKIVSGVGEDIAETKLLRGRIAETVLVRGRKPGVGDDIAETKLVRGRKPGSGEAVFVAQAQKSKPRSGKAKLQILRGSDDSDKAQSRKSSEEVRDADDSPGKAQLQILRGPDQAQSQGSVTLYQFNPTEGKENSGMVNVSWAQKSSTKVMCSHDILPDSDKASPTPLTSPNVEDWKRGLPMNFARYNPHTMVVDHKLYVLGGFLPNQNQAYGWIEVFDPEEKRWESLPGPPDQIHSSIMISGLLKSKKEIIIAKHCRDCRPLLFYSYNITTRCWNELSLHSDSKASVHSNVERAVILPPNIGRAVTVGNTLYWISTEEHNHECTIHAYDLDRNMWFEDHLNTAKIFGRREYFASIYSRGPGFLHLVDQKFCLLLQSSVKKKDPQSSIEYLYCVILDISPIYEHEHEDWGKFELTTVSVQKYSMNHYIDFLDCMLLHRGTGFKSVDHRE